MQTIPGFPSKLSRNNKTRGGKCKEYKKECPKAKYGYAKPNDKK